MIRHSPIKNHLDDQTVVEAEHGPKTSGTDNLSREGWNEEQCRNFLVRVMDWVPRNFNYEDGLRIIHPQLQERFGDENVDLACGVLDELIEVDVFYPFPGSSYQRWKYTHRHRSENLMLPHVPHTTTIMAPRVVPTKTLVESYSKSDAAKAMKAQTISLTSPTFKTGISTITHRSVWRIEHTLFVSTGGGKASVYHCPSPEEFHQRLWDPEYGRGGNLAVVKTHNLPHPLIRIGFNADVPPDTRSGEFVTLSAEHNTRPGACRTREFKLLQAKIARLAGVTNNCDCNMQPPLNFQDAAYEKLASPWAYQKPGSEPRPGSFSPVRNVPLPAGVIVPNAVFARKHKIVPDEAPLPDFLLKGQMQPTADRLAIAKIEHLYELVSIGMDESRKKHQDLDDQAMKEHEDMLTTEYFSFFKGPFTADLFYDSGLDFKWSTHSEDPSLVIPMSVVIDNTPMLAERRGFLSSLSSPKKKVKKRANSACLKPISKSTKEMASAERQEHRRKQIITVSGRSQLIGPQRDRSRFRDSRFFGVFQRKKAISSSSRERFPHQKYFTEDDTVGLPDTTDSLSSHNVQPSSLRNGSTTVKDETSARLLPKQLLSATFLAQKDDKKEKINNLCRPPPKTPTRPRKVPRFEPLGRLPLHELPGIYPSCLVATSNGETLKPTTFIDETAGGKIGVKGRLKAQRPDIRNHGFDGPADEADYPKVFIDPRSTTQPITQSCEHYTGHSKKFTSLCSYLKLSLMDSYHALLHRSATPKPLEINKQLSSQSRAISNHRQNVNNQNNDPHIDNLIDDQLLPSSVYNAGDLSNSSHRNIEPKLSTIEGSVPPSSLSGSNPRRLVPDTTSGIMGDFVALAPVNIEDTNEGSDVDIQLLTVTAKHRYPQPVRNPYEFERSPLLESLDDENHLGKFRNFLSEHEDGRLATPRSQSRMRYSQNHGNGISLTRKATPSPSGMGPRSRKNTLPRSESSPVVSPVGQKMQRYARYQEPRIPDPRYYTEDIFQSPSRHIDEDRSDIAHQSRRRPDEGRSEVACHPCRRAKDSNGSNSSGYEHYAKYPPRTSSRSPTRHRRQESLRYSYSGSSYYDHTSGSTDTHSRSSRGNHNQGRSPIKALVDLSANEALEVKTPRPNTASSPSLSPPQRARSPMKKMFGENGWLSNTPIVNQEAKFPPAKVSKPKKSTMMGKLKNKFGEMAEKADLTPIFRNSPDKDRRRPTQPSITRSISPFEQARIYTELELMMVHTANIFLMKEFSQARIGIDTIRKTIDSWKGKGRPMVTEFMYDQNTQRNLVAMNQNSLRFHGPEAGNDIRVDSMLYNWKQVANQMAVRTFCDTDPIILKLLFDIEHVLELLGAGEPFMLRLQHIGAGVKGTIHAARQDESSEQERMNSKSQQQNILFG